MSRAAGEGAEATDDRRNHVAAAAARQAAERLRVEGAGCEGGKQRRLTRARLALPRTASPADRSVHAV